jgi:hypothetical protein
MILFDIVARQYGEQLHWELEVSGIVSAWKHVFIAEKCGLCWFADFCFKYKLKDTAKKVIIEKWIKEMRDEKEK